ncbi:MAG: class IV adenylate cyclase [Rubripirellula sp.]
MTIEVEQKFHVDDLEALELGLKELGATEDATEDHRDTYYNHPCRDFAETQEAFRIRRVGSIPMVTYKGPKLPGAIKARRELEWRLDPGDPDGSRMEDLLNHLSFRKVATVGKRRRPFTGHDQVGEVSVVIDEVDSLGLFAEIELIVESEAGVEQARQRIADLSVRLGLHRAESQSYLRMVLTRKSSD